MPQPRIPYLVIATVLLLMSWSVLAEETEFPGRKTYPNVSVISLEQLEARRDETLVVDVRSAHEYQTLHIKGAINIPVSDVDFAVKMADLRAENVKDIVVYCNGKTCMKSYKAARKSAAAGISNVLAYDAGIMDWARAYPGDTILLGKVLGNPGRLISKKTFKKHLLSPDAFSERMASSKAYVLDVRDLIQRDSLGLFPGRERRVHLDNTKKLNRYIRKALRQNRSLLIYDATGKQVRWLQYYLRSRGVKNYYFMAGGVRAYYREMTNDFVVQ